MSWLDRLDDHMSAANEATNRAVSNGLRWGILAAEQEAIAQQLAVQEMDVDVAYDEFGNRYYWNGYKWQPC